MESKSFNGIRLPFTLRLDFLLVLHGTDRLCPYNLDRSSGVRVLAQCLVALWRLQEARPQLYDFGADPHSHSTPSVLHPRELEPVAIVMLLHGPARRLLAASQNKDCARYWLSPGFVWLQRVCITVMRLLCASLAVPMEHSLVLSSSDLRTLPPRISLSFLLLLAQ